MGRRTWYVFAATFLMIGASGCHLPHGGYGCADGHCGAPHGGCASGDCGGHGHLAHGHGGPGGRHPLFSHAGAHHSYHPYEGPTGPPAAAVTYPYYTVRGPRDFLIDNPPSIGH